jgi:phosphoribosylaminoimidazole-succinocarboxamide synthase
MSATLLVQALNQRISATKTMDLIYEGKAKKLFTTENPSELIMQFKDDATAFNGEKKSTFADKGRLNKQLSLHIYQLLEKEGVATHFVRDDGPDTLIVKRVEIIPIEVVIRNVVAGSLRKRTGLPEGQRLRQPLIECYYKSDELGDPMVNDEHIRELNLARGDELEKVKRSALKVNRTLTAFFAKAGLTLVDFKLEYGRLYPDKHNIVLADEISPDTCRLWDAATGNKLDKDRFRQDLGDLIEGYSEVLKRVENALAAS